MFDFIYSSLKNVTLKNKSCTKWEKEKKELYWKLYIHNGKGNSVNMIIDLTVIKLHFINSFTYSYYSLSKV